jgi:hypothetical protein
MKKTDNGKRSKLTLNLETVRTLTNQELTLVVGGACKHGTGNSTVPPPDGSDPRKVDLKKPPHTTC